MLRYLSAGESHGPALTVILDGVPAGLELVAPSTSTPGCAAARAATAAGAAR
jgi:hypothetical protein